MNEEEKKAIELLKKFQKKTPYIIWGDGTPYNKSNQIQTILNLIEKQQKEIDLCNEAEIALNNKIMDLEIKLEKKDREIQIKNNYLDLIWQIGYDYDGVNKVESLKELIDELVDYAVKAKNNDDKSVMFEGYRGKEIINQNILYEEVDETNG